MLGSKSDAAEESREKTAALRRPSGKRRKIACKITDKKKKTVHKGEGLREEAPGGDREEPAQSQKKRAGTH